MTNLHYHGSQDIDVFRTEGKLEFLQVIIYAQWHRSYSFSSLLAWAKEFVDKLSTFRVAWVSFLLLIPIFLFV